MFLQCNIQDEKYIKLHPLTLGHHDCKSNHTYGPAVRMYWLLHYVVSGKGKYFVNGKEYDVFPGQVFLIRPGEITTYKADKENPWEYIWTGFDADSDKLNDLPYVMDSPELKAIFEKILSEFDFTSNDQPYAIARIWEIFGVLTNNSFNKTENSYITRALNIIKRQYMHDISVQTIANELILDRSYFSNIFKKKTGRSPGQYILDYRMYKAYSLLSCEKYSISVVATSVGYGDLFSFSRSFKKYFGVSPQKFKEITEYDPAYILDLSE